MDGSSRLGCAITSTPPGTVDDVVSRIERARANRNPTMSEGQGFQGSKCIVTYIFGRFRVSLCCIGLRSPRLVVIHPKARRRDWRVGRVVRTYPGGDGLVRVVDVKVGDTTLQRPVSKLSPLEMKDKDFNYRESDNLFNISFHFQLLQFVL